MSRRLKFQNQAQLNAAFARIVDQGWVDSCCVDVPALELHVDVAAGQRQHRTAEAWLAREQCAPRRRSPHD